MQRIPSVQRQNLPTEGQLIWDQLEKTRGSVFGPYAVLMHSPQLAQSVGSIGEYLRFRGKRPDADRELAILVAAQHSASEFEWFVHEPIALSAGLSPEVVASIKEGKTPVGLASRQSCIIDVVGELFRTKTLSEESFLAAQSELNNECLIEVIVIAGFYQLLAFVLNAFDVQVPSLKQ